MKLGYFAMPLHPPERSPSESLEHDLQQVEFLDQLGYDEFWIGEHQTHPWENVTSPDVFLAAASQRSKTIRLGTGVATLPSHHPVHVANRLATLDHLSGGRLNFGVGTSGFEESELFDIDWRTDEHRALFTQALDDIVDLWQDPKPGRRERTRYPFVVPEPQGDVIRLHMKPLQQPHPPILVGSFTPRSAALTMAGGKGWAPLSINFVPLSALQSNWEAYTEGAEAAGRVPDRREWRIARDVIVGDSAEHARELAVNGTVGRAWRELIIPSLQSHGVPLSALAEPDAGIAADDGEGLIEWLSRNTWVLGDTDSVTEQLSELYRGVGGFGTLLAIASEWDDDGAWKRSLTRLKRDVLPRLPSVSLEASTA